jgi:DNA-directed RNA polymerase specialized sigma24 family protein
VSGAPISIRTATFRGLTLRGKPDEVVFQRALDGDEVAFSEVYRRYHRRIFGFCLARSMDPHTAADATQEVFMRLLKATPGSIDSPQAWLFTVAQHHRGREPALRRRLRRGPRG